MTLAMMQIGAGISAVLVRGQIAYTVPPLILTLGSKSIFGVPWIIIVAAIFLLVAHLVLTYTRFGRYVYMVGGNREAAEYSGVNVRFIVGAVMVISAVCSGIAGMLGVAYFGSAQQNEFDTFLLDAIAAVVVGGTSLFGGRGGIGNTIVGLFVLGVLNNGLDYVKIDSFLKILIRGLILLAALIINVYAERLRTARSGSARADRMACGAGLSGAYPAHITVMSLRYAHTGVGGDERKIAVEAMGDQHAVERVAIVPVERARRFSVRAADRQFEKAGRESRGAWRSLQRELASPLLDRDFQEGRRADIDVQFPADRPAQEVGELR